MHIAIITAGGAGMFCGSCMHDNTWARALMAAGHEVSLIPTYTPIRVDEDNVSTDRIFFGGLNVYLDYRFPLWRKLPRALTRWLDSPGLINLITRYAVSNNAQELGALTVAMLEGMQGPERREAAELSQFLSAQLKPDVICFSNMLLSGAVPPLRQHFDGPIFCLLQGDDVFLQDLPQPYQSRSLELISGHGKHFDGFLAHSEYYADFMSAYMQLPREKFHRLPLGIDLSGHDGQPGQNHDRFTVGYFARICPEKGLHALVDAFRLLRERQPEALLRVGGYLGKRDADYFQQIQRSIAEMGPSVQYIGSPNSHEEKVAFLKSLDVLSVPTVYHEPKGIYILEALANGVPVVEPRHGAFPELIDATGGGLLVEPESPAALADALETLSRDREQRQALAVAGHAHVHQHFGVETMVAESARIFGEALR